MACLLVQLDSTELTIKGSMVVFSCSMVAPRQICQGSGSLLPGAGMGLMSATAVLDGKYAPQNCILRSHLDGFVCCHCNLAHSVLSLKTTRNDSGMHPYMPAPVGTCHHADHLHTIGNPRGVGANPRRRSSCSIQRGPSPCLLSPISKDFHQRPFLNGSN